MKQSSDSSSGCLVLLLLCEQRFKTKEFDAVQAMIINVFLSTTVILCELLSPCSQKIRFFGRHSPE